MPRTAKSGMQHRSCGKVCNVDLRQTYQNSQFRISLTQFAPFFLDAAERVLIVAQSEQLSFTLHLHPTRSLFIKLPWARDQCLIFKQHQLQLAHFVTTTHTYINMCGIFGYLNYGTPRTRKYLCDTLVNGMSTTISWCIIYF